MEPRQFSVETRNGKGSGPDLVIASMEPRSIERGNLVSNAEIAGLC